MTTIKKLRLIFAILVTAGFLVFFTWQQWSDNQTTILERMEPIPPLVTYTEGGSIDYIAFDPKNPELIASARSGDIVKIWNLNRQDSPVVTLKTHNDLMPIALLKGKEFMSYVDTLEFSQDGKFLAAAGWSGILWIWNVSELYEN